MDALELLRQNEQKDLLRFLTAGSVDDGKSTLIGRLLYEAKGVYEDQLASVKKASSRRGAAAGEMDFSLFTDGLKAEREQNITIDVAYRYFSTPRRKFIIADTPGHEQYTRNMVTGASTASLMVILIDAAKGMIDQSRRHAFIASLLGIQHIVVAVNKMDLVDYSAEVFERIRREFTEFAAKLQAPDVTFIPVSALRGDNVVARSKKTPWYGGSTLLNHLETVHVASDRNLIDLRFPVQYVCRPDATFRGYMGTVASGVIRPGDQIVALPAGTVAKVREVLGPDGPIPEAFPPMACCVVLEEEIDLSRGDMLVHPHNRPSQSDQFEAMLVWLAQEPLQTGRPYQLKQTTRSTLGEATTIRYRIDVNTLHHGDTDSLEMNEVGRVVMKLGQPIAYDPYSLNRATGAFILIDRVTNNTVGAGMILPRDPKESQGGEGILPSCVAGGPPASAPGSSDADKMSASQVTALSPEQRAQRMGHRPATLCLCGPAASALPVAHALERRLFDAGFHCHVLLDRDVQVPGLSQEDALRFAARMARVLNEAGLISICAISGPGVADALRRELTADQTVQRQDTPKQPWGCHQVLEIQLCSPTGPAEAKPPTGVVVSTKDLPQCVEQILTLLKDKGIIRS
jgi:bifunctional enzyme CysN/CysC